MAKVFRFRLQKILGLRIGEEKTAERALAAVNGECQVLQNSIQEHMVRRHTTFLHRGTAGTDWSALRSYDLFSQRLAAEIEKQEKMLAAKLLEREKRLAEYVEARKKVKVLEKLAEKQRQEFKEALEKEDVLRLDDLNTAAFIRKMAPVEDVLG